MSEKEEKQEAQEQQEEQVNNNNIEEEEEEEEEGINQVSSKKLDLPTCILQNKGNLVYGGQITSLKYS